MVIKSKEHYGNRKVPRYWCIAPLETGVAPNFLNNRKRARWQMLLREEETSDISPQIRTVSQRLSKSSKAVTLSESFGMNMCSTEKKSFRPILISRHP